MQPSSTYKLQSKHCSIVLLFRNLCLFFFIIRERWILLKSTGFIRITAPFSVSRKTLMVVCWGWHSHYGGDADVRLQRPPISALLSPNDPLFLPIVSAVTQRPHTW